MSDREPLGPDDWSLWRDFVAMTSQLNLALDRQLRRDAALSQADYRVMVVLAESPGRRQRTGELAELLGWEKSRVSHQIARMESRGLVERSACDDDARGTWVAITTTGARTVLAAARKHTATIRELFFDALLDEEPEVLRRVSQRILDRLNPAACDIAEETGLLSRDRRRATTS